MRPAIVLTTGPQDTEERRAARARYTAALEHAGASVIAVGPGETPPATFDGLCLSGGGDVDPAAYGEKADPATMVDPGRDTLEFPIARRARELDAPILGICRGFQVLNVAFGGTLVQDVHGHRVDGPLVEHAIRPVPGSRLAAACGVAPFGVNSRHHQAVTLARLAPGLAATARVGDLIEAFESTADRFVVGVQWHPERVGLDGELDPMPARALFAAFVAASRSPAPAR